MCHVQKRDLVDVRKRFDSGGSFKSTGRIRVSTKKVSSSTWRHERDRDIPSGVTNRSNRRIGVVIAVDGKISSMARNRTWNPNERMYIIGAQETNTSRVANRLGQDEQVLLHRAVRLVCGEGLCRCVQPWDHCSCCIQRKLPESFLTSAVHPMKEET